MTICTECGLAILTGDVYVFVAPDGQIKKVVCVFCAMRPPNAISAQ
jgi:hypothetical protein